MITSILLSSIFLFSNFSSCSGLYNVQRGQGGIQSRQISAIKCAIDNIHDGQLEPNCELCVRQDKSNAYGNSVYLKKKNANETCPVPWTCTQTTGAGKSCSTFGKSFIQVILII